MGSNQQQPSLDGEVSNNLPEVDRAAVTAETSSAAPAAEPIAETDIEAAQSAAPEDDEATELPPTPPEPGIMLYRYTDLVAWRENVRRSSTDRDTTDRNQAIIRVLAKRGPFRSLLRLPADWEPRLDQIQADYPHFAEFLDYVRTMCVLAMLDNGVVELELTLFDGPPGTGKSTLVACLEGLLGGAYVRASMSAAEAGALLGGSQETWSNSKPGLVFTTLTEGRYANPIFLLDEIDKVSTDSRLDPLGPCYQLLEPALAQAFVDLSVPTLPLDASKIVWIGTSNDASRIPEPIRQRFTLFNIPLPTAEQSLAVVRSVMRWLQNEHPRLRRFTLDDGAADALIGQAPRQMRKQINLGCGKAARAGRKVVLATDLPADAAQSHRIGF